MEHRVDGRRAAFLRARESLAATLKTVRPRGRKPLSLRRPGAQRPSKASDRTLPSLAVRVLNRAAYGPAPGDVEAFEALGATDEARLIAWVDTQLDPESIVDAEVETRIAAGGYQTLDKSLTQLWLDHVVPDPEWWDRMRPIMETQAATVLRKVYSKRQLFEVLADFWHNHFNVYGWHYEAGPVFVHYDRDVIRAHTLGNFRQMLEADASSTSMLFYLDNVYSGADGPNENYAREVLELHTLGEEHYYGAVPASEIPVDAQGIPLGYCDEDVRELARCLTGWSVDEDTGEFLYRADWHDDGAKTVLGLDIPAGLPPLEDVRRVFDRLAVHSGTARFVCKGLYRRLVSDTPSTELVDAVAAVFLAEAGSDDQIARVVRTILLSPEFSATWGEKIKRPTELIVAAMRAMNPDFDLPLDADFTNVVFWLMTETAHMPFEWRLPTGYPDTADKWTGSNAMVMSWRMINYLSDAVDPQGLYFFDTVAATPSDLVSAVDLADYWIDRCLGRPMEDHDRQEIVDFMAQGHIPTLDLGMASDEDVQSRLRTMVAMLLTSPDAYWI